MRANVWQHNLSPSASPLLVWEVGSSILGRSVTYLVGDDRILWHTYSL